MPNFDFLDRHYVQHSTSVAQARRGAAERIAKIEENTGIGSRANQIHYSSGHTAGGSERYVAGCSTCMGYTTSTNRLSQDAR